MTNTQIKAKENAYTDWFEMIFKSWTWEKLTESEREKFIDEVDKFCSERSSFQILKGTYRQRWDILQALYSCYLDGLGYKPIGWRENAEENSEY